MLSFLFKNRRRRKLLAQPLPEAWRGAIERNVAVYALLSEAEKQRLEDAVKIIVAERPIVGCQGLVAGDEMKVTIAAQAALLLLGEEGYYFDRLPSVLVYASAYSHRHSLGAQHPVDEDAVMFGEAWHRGSIVLSWPAVLAGGRDPRDGQNLVLHEFAHHLDSLDGEMGGLPPLPTQEAEDRWLDVFGREYDRLMDDVADGRRTVFDPYGTTSKAEFFAVATEAYFERPLEMRGAHAELFACFRDFYKVDPSAWFEERLGERRVGAAVNLGDHAGRFLSRTETPTVEDLPPLATADQYFTRGYEAFHEGRFEAAEADFNLAVRLAPEDQEALVYRAECRFRLDHLEAALADAERACQLDSEDMAARRIRGLARVALERYEEGLADLDAALADHSGEPDTDALFFRGIARAELGQHRQAIDDLSRVIKLEPDDAEAWQERASCYEALGNFDAAERDLARARALVDGR
jgi:Mlc titration factor MtfA (ptsG expression regulator)/Flp pilus assembly protein TadD